MKHPKMLINLIKKNISLKFDYFGMFSKSFLLFSKKLFSRLYLEGPGRGGRACGTGEFVSMGGSP